MKLIQEDIAALDDRYRVLFINSLSGFKSANLVGTANAERQSNLVAEDGFISLEKAGSVAVSSLDTYHSTQTLASLSYAKPDRSVTKLSRPTL